MHGAGGGSKRGSCNGDCAGVASAGLSEFCLSGSAFIGRGHADMKKEILTMLTAGMLLLAGCGDGDSFCLLEEQSEGDRV